MVELSDLIHNDSFKSLSDLHLYFVLLSFSKHAFFVVLGKKKKRFGHNHFKV